MSEQVRVEEGEETRQTEASSIVFYNSAHQTFIYEQIVYTRVSLKS